MNKINKPSGSSSPSENTLRIVSLEKSSGVVRVAIYVRVSGKQQLTIPEQIRIAQARAGERGWKVRYILKDHALKGDDFERPKFQFLFDLAERHAIDVVLVWRIDRLARSLAHACVLEEMLRENGVAVHSCTEPIDTTTSTGRFVFGILASAAQLEKEIIRERILMGKQRVAHEGRWATSSIPFGYRRTKGSHLRIHPVEAEAVRSVFRSYLEAGSDSEAAARLIASGLTYRGEAWTRKRVQNVVTNEIYGGIQTISGITKAAEHLRIIPAEVAKSVAALRTAAPRRGKVATPSVKDAAIESVFRQYLDSLGQLDDGTLGVD